MAGADERRSKRRIYLKMFLRVWASNTLVIAHSNGFSITTSNGVLARISPTSHPLFRHGLFSAVSSGPDCFHI